MVLARKPQKPADRVADLGDTLSFAGAPRPYGADGIGVL